MKVTTISIGIPALNEEKSIGRLIGDLLVQNQKNLKIVEILVASDGSTDRTVEIVKSIAKNNPKVKLTAFKNRLGRAARQNQLMRKAVGDIFVLLDGDIHITDKQFVKKLVLPIIVSRAEMTSSALVEFEPRTFFEKSLYVSMRLKDVLFDTINNGNNVYTCHGPARAFSKALYREIIFPSNEGEDMYSYLYCVYTGRRFLYVKKAEVLYRLPDNFDDHRKQSIRYHNSKQKYFDQFDSDFIKQELRITSNDLVKSLIKSIPIIVKYPHHVLQYLFVLSYLYISKGLNSKLINNDNWQVTSSKI